MSVPNLPSGPSGFPVIGNLPTFARDPFGFFTRLQRDYGDVARFTLGTPAVLISHPDDIERVLLETGKHFHKGYQQGFAFPLVLGNGLVTSEGDFWRRQRKLMSPAFHTRRIASYADIMVRFTEDLLADWNDGQTRDVHQEMMHLTQRIVAKTLFSTDVAGSSQDVGRHLM